MEKIDTERMFKNGPAGTVKPLSKWQNDYKVSPKMFGPWVQSVEDVEKDLIEVIWSSSEEKWVTK